MTQKELNVIIKKHKKWLKNQECGERADLTDADLTGAVLTRADLTRAVLTRAVLTGADLTGAVLTRAVLTRAVLTRAVLTDAVLTGAVLTGAVLTDADLTGAVLTDAKNAPYIPMSCPDSGSFTAWKKASGYIVKLLIPEDARRSSATGRKCRCDKAQVIAIETVDGENADSIIVHSDHDFNFAYEVGKIVTEPNFCEDRFRECAPGIHFFINRQEAVDYN